jgi:cyd operon protein YbgT
MWYFSWILGTGLALAFAVLNAIWYEIVDLQVDQGARANTPPMGKSTASPSTKS